MLKKLFDDLYQKLREDFRTTTLALVICMMILSIWGWYMSDNHWQTRYDKAQQEIHVKDSIFSYMKVDYQVKLDSCNLSKTAFIMSLYNKNANEIDKLRARIYKLQRTKH